MSEPLFDPVAAEYDAARPGYPDALYDEVERLAGPLRGRRVLEVAAGTGLGTQGLRGRGASVVACDLGPRMVARLRERLPAVPALVARAEALPVRAGAVDLVTCATAWHWVDPALAPAEALRVLRPGGRLVLWWAIGVLDDEVGWERRQAEVYRRWGVPRGPAVRATVLGDRPLADLLVAAGFARVEEGGVSWERTVGTDEHVRHLATHSPVISLRERAGAFLADVRAALAGEEQVVERFLGPVLVATAP